MVATGGFFVFVFGLGGEGLVERDGRRGPDRRAGAAPPVGPVVEVHKLSSAERARLGDQIAATLHAARGAPGARASGSAPPDEDPVIPLDAIGPVLRHSLDAAIPILAACFEHAGITDPRTAVARMTMASDPDLGSVIDTAEVVGPDGAPLGRELDTCLRDSIDALALPPLGQRGKLALQYSFRFDGR